MKKNILWILLESIFLIIFNTVFFVAGGCEHSASVWISYAFIHFSYIMILATPLLIRKSNCSAIFGFSLYSISSVYFFLEFVVGLLFIFVESESYKAALLTQIIIAGIYAVLLLANLIANEHTAENIERHEEEVVFIKESSSRIKLLIDKSSDKKANEEIGKLYDLLHSSPSKSIIKVKNIEIDIENRITELECAIHIDDTRNTIIICEKLVVLIEERNSILKSSN